MWPARDAGCGQALDTSVYRPILYEQREAAGIVTSRLRFNSYRGEDIDSRFRRP